jgi:hypothetical protein
MVAFVRSALRLVGLAFAIAAVAAPCPASAGVTFGVDLSANADTSSPCPSAQLECSAVLYEPPEGGRAGSPIDGVVTMWRTRAATTGATTFLVVRRSGSGTYRVVASNTQDAQANAISGFRVRIPIREGDLIGLDTPGALEPLRATTASDTLRFAPPLGAMKRTWDERLADTALLVNAVVEPDADGDGFGDDTQDACPANAASQDACSGTRFGPLLTDDAQWQYGAPASDETLANDAPAPGGSRVPADGVIVRWRIRSFVGSWTPQVLRPAGGAAIRSVLHGAEVELATPNESGSPAAIRTVASRLPVKAGDLLGIRGGPGSFVSAKSGGTELLWSPALADGESRAADLSSPYTIAINADLEPDADGDGYGDITQDGCPASAAHQGACPVEPGPGPTGPLERFGVADLLRRSLSYAGGRVLRVPVGCPATAERCAGVIEARTKVRRTTGSAARVVRLGRARFSIPGGRTRTLRIRLSQAARRVLRSRRRTRLTMLIRPAGPRTLRRSVPVRARLRQPA